MSHLRLAWAQIRTRLWAMAAAVAVVALGVGLAAGMLLANHALRAGFARSIGALAGRAELTVRPYADGTVDQALLERIAAVPGVAAAVPVLATTAVVDGDEATSLQLVGVDLLDDATVRVYRSTPGEAAGIEDPLVFLNQPGSAIAPRSLLERHGLDRGATLAVRTAGGRHELTIRGVLEDDGVAAAFGGGFLIVDLYALQDALALPGRMSWADVAIASGASAETVRYGLLDALPEGVRIESAADQQAEHTRTVAGFEAMVSVVAAVGLLLAGVITSNRLATLYQDRLWEIGVLRGIGWSPGGLVHALLGEAALLSALGVALGLPLGMLFAEAIVGRLAFTMTLNFQQPIAAAPVEWRIAPLLLAAVAGIGSGVLAGWLPARRAARQAIASLKSGRRRRAPLPESRCCGLTRVAVAFLAGAALAAQLASPSAVLGGPAMLLLISAAWLSIRPALRAVAALGSVAGESAAIGLRDQSRAPGRPVGAATVLTLGLALVVWIANTTRSFEGYIAGRVLREQKCDLLIDSKANQVATGAGTLRLPAALADELRRFPGVAAVGTEVVVRVREPELGVVANDAARLLDPRLRDFGVEPGGEPDALLRAARGEAVLIDPLLRDRRGLGPGDRVRIRTPNGPIELPVAGVTETSLVSSGGNVLLAAELYRRYWGDDSVVRIYVAAEDGVSREALRQRIEERFGGTHAIRVKELRSYAAWVAESVRRASSFLYAMAVITLLVVLIGTSDALASSVIERTREIGILRAIGYRPGAVGRMVLAQSLAIGVAGAALAVALGTAMAVTFVEGVLPALLGWQLEVRATWGLIAGVALLGLGACLTGGLWPAHRASRLAVAAAIRYE